MPKSAQEKDYLCRICGRIVPPVAGRGRPREYDSDVCRNLSARLSEIAGLYDQAMRRGFAPGAWRRLYQEHMRLGNQINPRGRDRG